MKKKAWSRAELENFPTIKRVIDKFRAKRGGDPSPSTEKNFFTYMGGFTRFYAEATQRKSVTPEIIMAERREDLKSNDDDIRRKHEELVQQFMNVLRQNCPKCGREIPRGETFCPHCKAKKSSSGKIALALVHVKAFYRSNYRKLEEVTTPAIIVETQFKVPTGQEWRLVLDACDELKNKRLKTWILCDKECGMSTIDLLNLTGKEASPRFGTILEQLHHEINPLHIRIIRQKTRTSGLGFYDTFLSDEGINALQDFLPNRPRKLFDVGERQLETDFIKLTAKINEGILRRQKRGSDESLWANFTSKSCRHFFSGQVKFAPTKDFTNPEWRLGGNAFGEYWMGHSIKRVEGSYIVEKLREHPEEMAKVYLAVYPELRVIR